MESLGTFRALENIQRRGCWQTWPKGKRISGTCSTMGAREEFWGRNKWMVVPHATEGVVRRRLTCSLILATGRLSLTAPGDLVREKPGWQGSEREER